MILWRKGLDPLPNGVEAIAYAEIAAFSSYRRAPDTQSPTSFLFRVPNSYILGIIQNYNEVK